MKNCGFILMLLLFVGCEPPSKKEFVDKTKINYSNLDFKKAFNLYMFQKKDSALTTLEDSIAFYNSGYLISSFMFVDQSITRRFRTDYFIEDIGCYSARNLFHIPVPSGEYSPTHNIGNRFLDHYLNPENLDSFSEKKFIEIDSIGKIWVPKLTVLFTVNIKPKPNFAAIRASISPILDSYSFILEKNAVNYFGIHYLGLNRNQKKILRKTAPLNFRIDFKEALRQ